MDNPQSLISVLVIGLLSSLHCLGMCGGIMGALSLSLPEKQRQNRLQLGLFVLMYNVGRILSYMISGALVATFGMELLQLSGLEQGSIHGILRIFGAIFMILIGLYLAGWLPQLIRLEKIGQPVWRILQPWAQNLVPIRSPWRALLYGLVWGWLPCGLVYVILLMTLSAGSALDGALMMGAFGLGTLPSMLTAGVMLGWLRRLAAIRGLHQMAGIMLIMIALATLFLGVEGGHLQHQH